MGFDLFSCFADEILPAASGMREWKSDIETNCPQKISST